MVEGNKVYNDMLLGETTLTTRRYKELLEAEEKLIALENAGVDNWEGYSIAMEEFMT